MFSEGDPSVLRNLFRAEIPTVQTIGQPECLRKAPRLSQILVECAVSFPHHPAITDRGSPTLQRGLSDFALALAR